MRELNHRNYMFMNQTVRYFTLNSTLRDVSSHPKQLQELKMKQLVGYVSNWECQKQIIGIFLRS